MLNYNKLLDLIANELDLNELQELYQEASKCELDDSNWFYYQLNQ